MTPLCPSSAVPACAWLVAVAALGCAPNQQTPPAGGGTVTGTVTYRECMALPADAEVQVLLADVSRQDAPAPTLAEATIRPDGRQVPLPFELRYDPAAIEANHTYAVRASIRSAGRLLFSTTTAYHVLTRGHPTHVDLLLTLVPVSATVSLWGTSWGLEDLAGAGVMDYVRATLEFPERGKIAGNGSCNRFFGSATITGDSIALVPLGSTQRACPEAVANQEDRYLTALRGATRFAIDGPWLLLYSSGLEQPLRFVAAE